MFDAAHPEFIDMTRIVEKAKDDADREGGVPNQLEEV